MLHDFRTTDITWDKASRRIYSDVRASSSDEKGRRLVVQILNAGQVEDLTGTSLNLYWETKDGVSGLDPFTAVDITHGVFEIYYRTGMLQHVGKLNAHLHLVDTTGAITSEPFTISVFKGVDVDAMASADELSALNKALIEVQNVKQDEAGRVASEQLRVSAETERITAEEERVSNENERKTAETIRVSNETNRVDAEDTRNTNETNRVDAETSRVTAENARVAAEKLRAESIRKLTSSIYMVPLQPNEVKWFKLPPSTIMRATFHANNFEIVCDVIAVRTASEGVKFTTVKAHTAFTVKENTDTQYFGIVCQYYARGLIQIFTV